MYDFDAECELDAKKEHRHKIGLCMDCGKGLRGNHYRCPSCIRRVCDIEEAEMPSLKSSQGKS